ncbi:MULTISPECIES: hypothetical protein [unclassified Mesorhizobium]|uniref:hypothetical protein n=1 Tax=unclassified Mesorhizobium TaxID=325217 RepID=UPI001FCCFC61|nr:MULTISPECIES: hypothetical protein [unclassified Mesorhizobium]
MDFAHAVGRQLHEIVECDAWAIRSRLDVDAQDQAALARISGNCQQPVVRRKAQVFGASDFRKRGPHGVACLEIDLVDRHAPLIGIEG